LKTFGKLSRSPFTAPRPTRGGSTIAFNREKEAPLTGKIDDLKASEGEERFDRTLDKAIKQGTLRGRYFRWTTLKRGVPGYKELDFLTISANGKATAVSIRGTDYVHRSSSAKNQDLINDLIIMQALSKLGYNVSQITNVDASKLISQEDSDNAARKLGLLR